MTATDAPAEGVNPMSTTTSDGTRTRAGKLIADKAGLGKTNAAEAHQRMVLRETLRLAVPMHMADLDGWPADTLAAIASDAATVIGSHGDALQFGGKHCREAFNALARGLAAAALIAQGGIDFAGLHWCANPYCRAHSRFDHADDYPATEPEPEPEPRPIVDIHLPEPDDEAA